jgi:hypothetical protein
MGDAVAAGSGAGSVMDGGSAPVDSRYGICRDGVRFAALAGVHYPHLTKVLAEKRRPAPKCRRGWKWD